MKTLTLLNPWATLLVAGIKTIETRSWRTNYRGWLAIHASKRTKFKIENLEIYPSLRDDRDELRFLEREETIKQNLSLDGYIIGVAELVDVVPVEEIRLTLDKIELGLGDYSSGRYAWLFNLMQFTKVPIPAKGSLGLWESPHCHSDNDGDCDWPECPQIKHYHPEGCPLHQLSAMDPSYYGE